MFDEQEEQGKSLVGYLVDMTIGDFRDLMAQANMTALLNLSGTLHNTYGHVVQVKNMLIRSIESGSGNTWASTDAVTQLHLVLTKIEERYNLVKDVIKQRDSDTDAAYRDYLNSNVF